MESVRLAHCCGVFWNVQEYAEAVGRRERERVGRREVRRERGMGG